MAAARIALSSSGNPLPILFSAAKKNSLLPELFFTVLRYIPSEQLALCERVSRRWFTFIDARVWQIKCEDEGAICKMPALFAQSPKCFYKKQFADLWQNAFGPRKWKTYFHREVAVVPRFPPSFYTTALKGQVTLLIGGMTLKEIARFSVASDAAGYLQGLENCTSWIAQGCENKVLVPHNRWVVLGSSPALALQGPVRRPSLMEAVVSLVTHHTVSGEFLWKGLIPCVEGYQNVDERFYPLLVGAEGALPYLKICSARQDPAKQLYVLSDQSEQDILACFAKSPPKQKGSCTIL